MSDSPGVLIAVSPTVAAATESGNRGAREQRSPATRSEQLVRIPNDRAAAPGPEPETDFIEGYVRYADVLEIPPAMHRAVAIQLIASVLNRQGVVISWGPTLIPFDLWIALLSGSGGGRSTLLSLANPILDHAELQDLEHSALWGSPQAVYQQLALRPRGLYVWGELSERLKLLNDPRFPGIKQWITDRYDNLRLPDTLTYRQTGRANRDTPPIVFPAAPRINIVATSSEEWFFNNIEQEDSTGGFVPRWLLIRTQATGRVVPIPQSPDPALVPALGDHLRRVAELIGEADLSLIEAPYREWYREAKGRFEAQPNRTLAVPYFSRHRIHVLKLAVIFEVSASSTLRVSEESWNRAVAMARELEETIFQLLGTGMNSRGYRMEQIEEKIRQAGARGIYQGDLTRAFQHVEARERKAHLDTIYSTGAIVVFERKTEGRNARILVHEEFAAAHHAEFPSDAMRTRP